MTLPLILPTSTHASAMRALRTACTTWWRSDIGWLQANHAVGMWLTTLIGETMLGGEAVEVGSQTFLEDLRRIVLRQMGQTVTLKDLAQAVDNHPGHLNRRIRALTGQSAGQWILGVKIHEAERLLRDTDKPMAQIAKWCGWRYVASFNHAFMRVHGCAPGRWRRSVRGEPGPDSAST